MIKRRRIIRAGTAVLVLAALGLGPSGCILMLHGGDALYQVSTLDALLAGCYDGAVEFSELSRMGDTGIGTVDGLDGEMVAVDGIFYRVDVDGSVHVIPDDETTPFAVVTYFQEDRSFPVSNLAYDALKEVVEEELPTKNIFYAVIVSGTFSRMTVRSVPGQSPPYPPLAEVVLDQAVFELEDVSGSMVGFYCPESAARINLAGFHLHFLTDDKTAGGHVLDCEVDDATVLIDDTTALYLVLPENRAFYDCDLSGGEEDSPPHGE